MSSLEEKLSQYSTGREGIKIPNIEWRKNYGASNIADFFHRFWAINSPFPFDHFDHSNGSFIQSKLRPTRELVIPPRGIENPLIVVRGEYRPKETVVREIGHTILEPNQGTERHAILIIPETAGQFKPLIELELSEHSSGYGVTIAGKVMGNNLHSSIQGFAQRSIAEVDREVKALNEAELQGVLAEAANLLTEY